MLCTVYSLFVFRLENSSIPGSILKKGRGNVLRRVGIRQTDPVVWLSDNRMGLYSDCI